MNGFGRPFCAPEFGDHFALGREGAFGRGDGRLPVFDARITEGELRAGHQGGFARVKSRRERKPLSGLEGHTIQARQIEDSTPLSFFREPAAGN